MFVVGVCGVVVLVTWEQKEKKQKKDALAQASRGVGRNKKDFKVTAPDLGVRIKSAVSLDVAAAN